MEVYPFLHDSKIKICEKDTAVELDLELSHAKGRKRILFANGKISARNKVRENGHIARLNKKVTPKEFGYEEIYTDFGKKYITLVLFYDKRIRGKRTISGRMILTIRYDKLTVM